MKRFLRKLLNSDQKPFIAVLAFAAARSAVVSSSNETSSRTSILVSVPEPLKDSSPLRWTYMKGRLLRPAFLSEEQSQLCFSPLSFARSGLDPPGDVKKEGSGEDGDGEKQKCYNCFGRDTIANAAATVGPAVVNISLSRGFHGLNTGRSIGSGTIIDADGTILTCAHVVDFQGLSISSKGKVDVTLQDGRVYEGTVVNADLHSDIAIVKIKSRTPLPTAKLGTSNKLRPGDWVVAMGCPLSLQNTITAGIVSRVDRKSSDLGLGGMRREYLRTDCAINAGNSGGPLVNVDGEVIGVSIMKVLAADGLGFAVPIDSVTKIIDHFKKRGKHFFLQVTPGSPADLAGFHPSDVVVEFDGNPVGTIKEIIDIMGDNIGKQLKAVVKRANDVTATLTVIPEEANPDM
ncbi:unnamed protein product [Withania somnifera]